ncbi:Formylglycine-generating enzyme, required for sulfatase activity, contains SUMF1/FGE domain [Fibrobacter sp. UWOV1]|uniref:formylglycine-generating enzyme family protein n=1 Tax=Fibrobacter sp. UWOV1 TaxID=1896215 RepID=UPI000911CAB0|nr:formylglycine-generating enzyme family protein [Fibrobacter sp. UWOV1]SHK51041.1 Formylglycine-generating enzyme, required for sulfatase activity, contains SUMF1/FGE domain [Fibrobacter sp. UWOV1]
MSLTRLLPLLLLLPILIWAADSDKNFRVAPTMFKEGVLMEPVANMAIVKKEKMILSESPMVPLRPNIMFMRHKKGPKEYLWFTGPVDVKNFEKLHAFSLADNYLRPAEVMLLRFYGSQTSRAFQDEADIYFDREYIYSPRVPKLYFRKNGQWQMIQETERPGIISIKSNIKGLEAISISVPMKEVPSLVYPVNPGMYAFSFSAPNYLPYVDAISVPGGSMVELKPQLPVVDTASRVKATTTVTLHAVTVAKTLEETEHLFDVLTRDVQTSIEKVDTNEFDKIYPPLRKPLLLGVSSDDSVYVKYRNRYNGKREEAKLYWRMNRMGSASAVNVALRRKIDSLQAIPHKVSLVPTSIEAVNDEKLCEDVIDSVAMREQAKQDSIAKANAPKDTTVKDSTAAAAVPAEPVIKTKRVCRMAAVRINYGKKGDRYDVSWVGNAEGYTADSLFALLTSGASSRAFISIERNKPVWIYHEGDLKGRHHYRYQKHELVVNDKPLQSHGAFELPQYIYDEPEVQEWLNRPIEEDAHKVQEPKAKALRVDESGVALDVSMKVPRVIRDRDRGTVALIDSGSFRYKGKVVSLSPFAIHTTEVTQQFFKDVMSKIDSTKRIKDRSSFTGARHPVHNITWNDAQSFCKAIGGDLPTEAQWEFAGRADNNEGALWNLDENPDPGAYAIYKANSYSLGKKNPAYGPQPVSTKKSNAWGIFDMSGNVAEWTRDKYFMFSVWVESSNPTGAMMGSSKVYKGGSWKDKESLLNLTERDDEDPRYWSDAIGFRCAFPRDLFEGK